MAPVKLEKETSDQPGILTNLEEKSPQKVFITNHKLYIIGI